MITKVQLSTSLVPPCMGMAPQCTQWVLPSTFICVWHLGPSSLGVISLYMLPPLPKEIGQWLGSNERLLRNYTKLKRSSRQRHALICTSQMVMSTHSFGYFGSDTEQGMLVPKLSVILGLETYKNIHSPTPSTRARTLTPISCQETALASYSAKR